MKKLCMYVLERLPWNILGPLIFLLVCMPLVYICPEEDQSKLIFLVAGAALTRVKISTTVVQEAPPVNSTESRLNEPPPGA